MTFCTCYKARIGSTAGLSRSIGYTRPFQQADTAGKTCAAIRANDAPPFAPTMRRPTRPIPVTSGLRPVAPVLSPVSGGSKRGCTNPASRAKQAVPLRGRNATEQPAHGVSPLRKNKRSVSRPPLRERLRPTHRAFRTNNASSQARTLRTRATPSAPGCRRRQPAPGPSARTAPRHQE